MSQYCMIFGGCIAWADLEGVLEVLGQLCPVSEAVRSFTNLLVFQPENNVPVLIFWP